jgi:hypothetical protein
MTAFQPTTENVESKSCSVCFQVKPLAEFHNDRNSKDGKVTRCKECTSAYCKAYKAINYEWRGKASREWPVEYSSHPGRPGITFKDYPYADGYKIGDDGSVWSRNGSHSRFGRYWHQLSQSPSKKGHMQVGMWINGKLVNRLVHRIILETFVGPCPPGMECRHVLNNNPSDNCLVNLAWGTKGENAEDKKRHGTYLAGSRVCTSKLAEADIPTIRALVASGITQADVARSYSVTISCINAIIKRRAWKHIP